MKNADKPITPIYNADGDLYFSEGELITGLTKREYFAGLAMQGLVIGGQIHYSRVNQLTSEAKKLADELLKQLEENNDIKNKSDE